MDAARNKELKNIVEAALLVAGQPLTLDRLAAMFPEGSQPAREEIRAVLEELAGEYAERGVEIKQIDRGFRIQTRATYAEYVARLLEERPQRYSRALLETLAIIVYRQPVTRGEIEAIRGVSVSTEMVRALLDRGWIKQVGVRDVPGRPALLGTTREFLEHFNLKTLSDLPPLAELRSLEEIGAELEQRVMIAPPAGPDNGEADDMTAAADHREPEAAPATLARPGARD